MDKRGQGRDQVDATVVPVIRRQCRPGLQLHALAYNLGNFLRTLATPEPIKDWSLTSLKEKLIKIGAKVVTHGRYVAFQMAEVAVPRTLFAEILRLIGELRPRLAAAPGMSIAGNHRSDPDGRGVSMIDREPSNAAARWGSQGS